MGKRLRRWWWFCGWLVVVLAYSGVGHVWASSSDHSDDLVVMPLRMHVMEGFLPPVWAAIWFGVAIPFWIAGFLQIRKIVAQQPEARFLLGIAGAYMFVLSALKLPSVTGSSSHPTGAGLGGIVFGPAVMSVLGSIVLLFQALLIAHGGITTLGANTVSMAIVGPFVAWGIWKVMGKYAPFWLTIFLASCMASLMTYVVTSLQLALVYPDPDGGVMGSFVKFGMLFAVTQIPLSLTEGIATVLFFDTLRATMGDEPQALGILQGKGA